MELKFEITSETDDEIKVKRDKGQRVRDMESTNMDVHDKDKQTKK